ncbi:hypothetical protein Hdeb2414_s0017g00502961 [Helianthus debilis subsp. tardiflorus]
MAESKISIKVYVDKVKKRVVYAEADYTFVDILFSFMTLPIGTIVKILGKHADTKFEVLGSLNNLYKSLKDFPECYLATEECKFLLLNPRNLAHDLCRNLKLKLDDTDEPIKYFVCPKCRYSTKLYSLCDRAKCSKCSELMNKHISRDHNVASGGGGVFVSDISTFIVTDDFSVMPYTASVSFRLLVDLGITDTNQLEERKLDLGREQMLYLLKMALSHGSPFTRLVFHSVTPILDLVRPAQGTTFVKCDVMKKQASTSLKMLLDVSLQKSTGRFLFAEAKEDFVDFLFSFLSIPLGTVIGTLMEGASSIICMDNTFKSISNMSVGSHLKSQDIKDVLVKPHIGQDYTSRNQAFPLKGTISSVELKFGYLNVTCLPKDPRIKEVFLKQSGRFFVTDDLVITPASSHLAMNILNKLKVSFYDVEKYEISIGLEELLLPLCFCRV